MSVDTKLNLQLNLFFISNTDPREREEREGERSDLLNTTHA